MIIRKQFKFEGAHLVRNCSSERCKKSIHGHSYIVEVFLESYYLDNGQMVVDFGLLKGTIKDFLDSFDHTYSIWDEEKDEFKGFMKSNSARWVEMPVSPSAEMYSLMFFAVIKKILEKTIWNNGEKNIKLHSVRVHETATGYAEAFNEDYEKLWLNSYDLSEIKISDSIKEEWKDLKMWDKILDNNNPYPFVNPTIRQQIIPRKICKLIK